MGELLHGRPPVRLTLQGPDRRIATCGLLAAILLSVLLPPAYAPAVVLLAITAMLPFCRVEVSGGGAPPISSRELSEWMAFYQLEPFGEERADLRAAIVATTIANAHRGKNQRPFKVEDFMPKFDRQPKTPEQMLAYVEMLNAAFGGKDLRQRG